MQSFSFLLSSSYALLSINLLGSSSAAFVFRLLADQKLRGPITSNDRLHGSLGVGSQSYWTGFTGSLMLGETLRLLQADSLFGCLGPANYRSRYMTVSHVAMWPRRFPLNLEQFNSVVPRLWDTPLLAMVTCLIYVTRPRSLSIT